MISHTAWAEELLARADELKSLGAKDLYHDEELHDRICDAIQRVDLADSEYDAIADRMTYPPEWDDLGASVEVDDPRLLLANMSGWVATGRWMEGPLALVHEKGWLEPALRRLAVGADKIKFHPDRNGYGEPL